MSLSEIRKIGDPILYKKSLELRRDEVEELLPHFDLMWRLIREFRDVYGRGRAIAAPQTGLLKRVIAIDTDSRYLLINPKIEYASDEMMELWDDCMSFPDLFVKVLRHKHLRISFMNLNWEKEEWDLSDDMAELIQHEYDHLDGILATERAIDSRSFRWGKP
ncbi:MAG: peptide deformylase [Marinilabiliaceae bacterium]|jgi:peptide deformylase|nr:peptide deformylase [Marinilabiliaceae bacterium]